MKSRLQWFWSLVLFESSETFNKVTVTLTDSRFHGSVLMFRHFPIRSFGAKSVI